MKLAPVVAFGASLLALSGEAAAGDMHMFLPVGGTLGYGFNPKSLSNGPLLGGEVSLAWMHGDKLLWTGIYSDVLHDFGAPGTRITLGPELGWAIFGVDGGMVLSTLDGAHAGFCGRFLISFAIVHAYMRVGHILDSPREGTYGELGFMLKVPIPLDGAFDAPHRRDYPRPEPKPQAPPPDLPVAAPEPTPEPQED